MLPKKLQRGGVDLVLALLAVGMPVGFLAYCQELNSIPNGARAKPAHETPQGVGPPRLQVEHKSAIFCVSWTPDGKLIATGAKDGTITILEVASGKEVESFVSAGGVVDTAFAPDGKTLAVCEDGRNVYRWDITNRIKQKSLPGLGRLPAEHIASCTNGDTIMGVGIGCFYWWSPVGGHGNMLVVNGPAYSAIAADGLIGGWCEAGGLCWMHVSNPVAGKFDPQPLKRLDVGPAHCIAFGPSAKWLAVGADDRAVYLWDLKAKKRSTIQPSLEKPATKLAFSADGNTLAALAGDGNSLWIYDLASNNVRCRFNHNRGEVGALALSPDGKMLATTAKDSKILYLWTTAARRLAHTDPPLELSAEELAAVWADLANGDFTKADEAWHKLGAAGDNALPFLRQHITSLATPAVDGKRIEKLVADLGAEKFASRERAIKELTGIGEPAIAALQRLLEKPPSAEARDRAKLVLKKLSLPVVTPDRQRVLDAIDLLEQLRSPAAIDLLKEIERDSLIPQIRTAAREALERIAKEPRGK
jgi:hypothetical protein